MLKNILNLEGITVLNKKQQSFVKGSGTCAAYIPAGSSSNDFSGNIPIVTGSTNEPTIYYGTTAAQAQQLTQGIKGAKWCCESCSQASWLGNNQAQ